MSKIHNIFFDFIGGERRRISASLTLSIIIHICVGLIVFYFFIKQDLRFKKGQDVQKIKISGFLSSLDEKNMQNFQNPNAQNKAKNPIDSEKTPKKSKEKKSKEQTKEEKKFDFGSLTLANTNSNSSGSNSQNSEEKISPSMSALLSRHSTIDNITKRDVIGLYGDEIGDYGLVEQDFIVNNLRDIGRITARYLRYPQDAVRLGQQGVNIVQFYLHPNGDISDLRLIKESGYAILDRNSERTIEIAYKDYPRPLTKTKIRIRVSMELYYY